MQKNRKKTVSLILCALFSVLVTLGALIRIPVFVVPVTMQTLFVLLSGMLLGNRRGAVSVLVYLAVGLCGLPVFAQGGGPMYLLHPTFGYLLGMVLGAYLTGTISEKSFTSGKRLFWAGAVGLLAIYVFGAVYLFIISRFYLGQDVTIKTLFVTGVLVFLPADLLSCALASFVAKKIRPAILTYL